MKNSYQTLCTLFQGERRTTLHKQLINRYHWSTEKASKAITQYLMFLSLASEKPAMPLIPTADIDCVWEADILNNTAQYIQLCRTICGRVIHHVEGEKMQPVPGFETIETAFSQTKMLFIDHFGVHALGDSPSSQKTAHGGALEGVHGGAQRAACGILITTHQRERESGTISHAWIS